MSCLLCWNCPAPNRCWAEGLAWGWDGGAATKRSLLACGDVSYAVRGALPVHPHDLTSFACLPASSCLNVVVLRWCCLTRIGVVVQACVRVCFSMPVFQEHVYLSNILDQAAHS